MSLSIRGIVRALPSSPAKCICARAIATTSSSAGPHSSQTTLHATGNVHSLGHSIEHNPLKSKSVSTQAAHGSKEEGGVWCVAGASGQCMKFGGVPMGAFAVCDTFSPAWRRSL